MKVLAMVPGYPPDVIVGAFTATHRHLAGLVAAGHDVVVMTRSAEMPYELDGVEVLPSYANVPMLARDTDVLVHHMHDGGQGERAAVAHGLRRVLMVHGPGGLVAEPDLTVACSRTAQKVVPWPSMVVMPTVVDPGLRPGGDHVTLVNRSLAKGVGTVQQIADRMPHATFQGVQGGWAEQVDLVGTNTVNVPCVDDMGPVWASTRVLLLPSVSETFGMVGLEACAAGIPVVAHPCDGLTDSLGDAAFFVDRDDIGGWVSVLEMLDDPEEYDLASKQVRAHFDAHDFDVERARFVDAVEALL